MCYKPWGRCPQTPVARRKGRGRRGKTPRRPLPDSIGATDGVKGLLRHKSAGTAPAHLFHSPLDTAYGS